jgi:hypothetical protein
MKNASVIERGTMWNSTQIAVPYLLKYLLTYLPTYLLAYFTEYNLLEKLTGSQPVKKFPAFYGTRKFITAFTRARQLSLS